MAGSGYHSVQSDSRDRERGGGAVRASACAGQTARYRNPSVRTLVKVANALGVPIPPRRTKKKPAHRSQRRNVGNGFPQAVPVFLFFSEVSGDPLPVLPGPPSRPVACVGGQCRCCGGRASQDGGVAPRQHSVTALALAERRPAQLPLWTQAAGAAKRSGAASRPGNEVFALLGRTGTRQCLVAVTGTAL